MKEILRLEQIEMTYTSVLGNRKQVLKEMNLSLSEGEVLGIVGPSGAGKTSLARIITGLLKPTSGTVWVPEGTVRQMIFQEATSSFDPKQTIGKGIGIVLKKDKNRKDKVLEIMQKCGLSQEFYTRYPRELSGGQCQRAAIARALLAKPQILVCDEPVSGLDASSKEQGMDLLETIAQTGKIGILFISHDQELVSRFCNRMIEIEECYNELE